MPQYPECPRRCPAGFTIVELAITLAIVGVLAATGVSRYQTYLDRARTARAIVELRGIAAKIQPFSDEAAAYPAALADVGVTTIDPWGRPYQYLLIDGNLPAGMASQNGGLPSVAAAPPGGGGGETIALARKDRFLVPINSDFDLYSLGPDGESSAPLSASMSRDDVIRAANGSFYGLAAKF